MRLRPRTISLGPWYAGSVRGGAFLVFLGVGLVPRGLGNWIRHQSGPETTDRDSAQRWPRRNPHALVDVGARLESHTARVSVVTVATVAVVAVASGRAAVAAEAKYTRETRNLNLR